MVDAVGGIYFDVDPSWGKGSRGVTIRHGYHKRYGKEALKLIRQRNYPNGDFTRIEHQQQFLREAIRQIAASSHVETSKLAAIASSHVETDMDMGEMVVLRRVFGTSDIKFQAATVTGRTGTIGGLSYILPDEESKVKVAEAMKKGDDFPSGPE